MNFSSISQVKNHVLLDLFIVLFLVNSMSGKNTIRIPQQERSRETKLSIINAGLKLFSEKGFYKTNSKEIAGEAGVSIGSFYLYFTDKKALFREVLVDYHIKIKNVVETIDIQEFAQTGNVKAFLHYLINKLIEAHTIYPQFHQEVAVMAQSDPDIAKIIENSKRESIEITKAMLFTWKDTLRIKDIDAAAIVIQTSTEELVHTLMFSKYKVSGERIINQLTEMLFRYLF
jgi:AcrR family transcriptional regulator